MLFLNLAANVAVGESVTSASERIIHRDLKDNKKIKQVIFKDLAEKFNLSIQHFSASDYPDSSSIQNLINHPVHIIDEDNKFTPSAFIPFCDIGGNKEIMGTRVKKFDVPVCNTFKAKVLQRTRLSNTKCTLW